MFAGVILGVAAMPVTVLAAEHDHHAAPDAPIGIMGHHMHPQGEWMLSYSYMQMDMEGFRDGTDSVATPLVDFVVTPTSMDMDMHMLGAMYGYSEKITLMAMLPVVSNSMDMEMMMMGNPVRFTTDASGVGDLKLSALFQTGDHWVSSVGLNLPTGSIDEKDLTPMNGGTVIQLPYPMQLGSGSYELTLGTTYIKMYGSNSWGNKADVIVRLNDNDRDYKLGNSVVLSSWYSYGVSDKSAVSARLKLSKWGNISGEDADLAMMVATDMSPMVFANLRAGTRADVLLGYNYQLSQAALVGLEVGVPVYQNLDGPQMETDLTLQVGVQYEF